MLKASPEPSKTTSYVSLYLWEYLPKLIVSLPNQLDEYLILFEDKHKFDNWYDYEKSNHYSIEFIYHHNQFVKGNIICMEFRKSKKYWYSIGSFEYLFIYVIWLETINPYLSQNSQMTWLGWLKWRTRYHAIYATMIIIMFWLSNYVLLCLYINKKPWSSG